MPFAAVSSRVMIFVMADGLRRDTYWLASSFESSSLRRITSFVSLRSLLRRVFALGHVICPLNGPVSLLAHGALRSLIV